jgi:hypothetical protein
MDARSATGCPLVGDGAHDDGLQTVVVRAEDDPTDVTGDR